MSAARQSARLRDVAAAGSVAAAAVMKTVTVSATTRVSKRTIATAATSATTAAASTGSKKKAKRTSAPAVDAAEPLANARADATTTLATDDVVVAASSSCSAAKGDAAKSAWGALFAQKTTAAKKRTIGARAGPKPAAAPISAELQARVDAFAAFEGVTPRTAACATKIVAWNVNGLRALLKRDESVHMRAYVAQEDPDVLCFSETKIDTDELQKIDDMWPQYPHQYWTCAAKKGYAGTAILSKTKPLSVCDTIVVVEQDDGAENEPNNNKTDDEGRFLALEFDKFWLVHTYVPNAGQKLERLTYRTQQWDASMLRMLKRLEATKPVVWCGDLNVAHHEIDLHDPKGNRKSAGFTDAERASFSAILAAGFVDTFRHFAPESRLYSYFGYRFNMRAKNKGWRLDYFVVSQALVPHVAASLIRTAVTGSDHVPIVLELQDI